MQTGGTSIRRTWVGVPPSWDELVSRADLHLASPWLLAVEQGRTDAPMYVVHEGEGGALHGSTVGYLVEGALDQDGLRSFTRVDHMLAAVAERLGSASPDAVPSEASGEAGVASLLSGLMPNLLCGGWTLVNSNLSLRGSLGAEERARVAAELLAGVAQAARDAGARSACFPYVEEDNHALREALSRAGFLEFPAASHYALDVTWGSFDEYVKLRRSTRRELAALESAGVTFRVTRLEEGLARVLAPLGAATVERHAGAAMTERMLDRLLMMARFGSEVILAERGGQVCGFGVIIEWGGQLYARMVGFDYQAQGNLPVYFGIMYEQVRWAIARGLRRIEYAIAAERAKVYRGAREIPQRGYIKVFDAGDAARLEALLDRARAAEAAAPAGASERA